MHITELQTRPETIMAQFCNEPYALWLDSADVNHNDGNWSFIAHRPVEIIEFKNGIITHQTHQKTQHFQNHDIFGFIRQRLKMQNIITSSTNIPFIGGAAGYFGYDLGRSLEDIPHTVQTSNTPDLVIGLYNQVYAYDHTEETGFLITHHDPNKDIEKAFFERIDRFPRPPPYKPSTSLKWQDEKTPATYKQDVQTIIDYIYAGEIYQANLTHRFNAKIPDTHNPFAHYLNLRTINAAPFAGYFNTDKLILASVSPERFIACSPSGHLQTKPIKGTMPRHHDLALDKVNKHKLATSIKDRAENIMIVDLLRNDLSKCAEFGSVKVPKLCALESFTHVHHLVSTITAQRVEHKDSLDVLKSAFPGGSITGAPKIRAQEIIDELETYARGAYCGAMGYIGYNGAMDTNIMIRTLVYEDDNMHFNVGGGIVADSNPQAEYQETLDKAAGIFESFSSNIKTEESAA